MTHDSDKADIKIITKQSYLLDLRILNFVFKGYDYSRKRRLLTKFLSLFLWLLLVVVAVVVVDTMLALCE